MCCNSVGEGYYTAEYLNQSNAFGTSLTLVISISQSICYDPSWEMQQSV